MDRQAVWSVIVAGISALCLHAPAESAPLLDSGRLPASSQPYAERSMLLANTDNVIRTIVPADEEMGLLQIHALVPRARLEEQWAYVPTIGLWVEIGKYESGTEADPQVETDMEYLRKLVGLFGTVHLVHLHPANVYIDGDWEERLFPVGFPAANLRTSDLRPIGYALPSPDDIWSSIVLSETIHNEFPEANIRHSVVSLHGMVSYGPTASGLAKIISESGNPRASIRRDIVTRTAMRRAEVNIARTVRLLGKPTIGDVIASLCDQTSDDDYVLTFTPF